VYTLLAAGFILTLIIIGALVDYTFDLVPMVIFMLLVAFLFNPVNLRIQRLVSRKIFHHKYDYQDTIKENSRMLVTILDYKALLQQIKQTIITAFESSTFTLLILNYDIDSYQAEISHGVTVDEKTSFTLNDQIIKFLIMTGHEVLRDQIDKDEHDKNNTELVLFFDQFKAELLVPMIYKNVMRGIMCLGKKESGQLYYKRDLELLQVLANQAVIAIDNARLYEMAIKDELTDLFIARFFKLRILEEINHSIRLNQEFSLLMIDIDYFKSVNDTHGHQIGDQVIREIALAIRKEVRGIDIVSRYGGEEFAVILPGANNQTALAIAERIRENVGDKKFSSGIHRTVYTGVVTVIADDLADFNKKIQAMPINARHNIFEKFREDIIRQADEALYKAKNSGRNNVKNNGILKLKIP
jgi:diguanylate cyclase (GGDEF)-like protein